MSAAVKWALIALLAALAGGYFAFMTWQAAALARVLLRKGYSKRGLNERQMTMRVKLLGWAGLAVSLPAFAVALVRCLG